MQPRAPAPATRHRRTARRTKLFGVLMRKEVAFHDINEAGQLTSRLTSDCYAISKCIATNVNVALRNGLQVIGEPSPPRLTVSRPCVTARSCQAADRALMRAAAAPAGGMYLLVQLSPQLTALCCSVFVLMWGATLLYGGEHRPGDPSGALPLGEQACGRTLGAHRVAASGFAFARFAAFCVRALPSASRPLPACLDRAGYSRYSQRVAQDVLAGSTASAEESFMAAKVVRTFGTEQLEQQRYNGWLQWVASARAAGRLRACCWWCWWDGVGGLRAPGTCIQVMWLRHAGWH
jgi:ABC-type multidrug transport system fused ATPase/permease subunit